MQRAQEILFASKISKSRSVDKIDMVNELHVATAMH